MDGAVIKNASIDGAKIQNATIGSAKIASLDVGKISGNTSNFVQSAWNSAAGGNVRITGSGVISTASNGAQLRIQNGVALTSQPNGATIGYIGYNQVGGSPRYTITTTLGSHFYIRQNTSDGIRDVFRIGAGGQDLLIDVDRMEISSGLNFGGRHYIAGANTQRMVITGQESIALRANESTVFAVSNNGSINFASMYANLNMNGSNVTNQSDARLKTDISTRQESSLDKINQFNFVDFKWIKDGREDFGVIAQQVQKVAPELILEGVDGYLNLNNSLLNMMTTHAVKELALRELNTNKVASQALQASETNEEKIHKLQQELSQANRKIKELEEKMSL